MAARKWTLEQRQQQSARIRAWSPWLHSTGPRTAEGKAAASRNGWKGGHRDMLRELTREVNGEIRKARELMEQIRA